MRQPHPHKHDEKEAFAEYQKRLEQIDRDQLAADVCRLMSEDWGRRLMFDLLDGGLGLPGQSADSTNGSLQSQQLGQQRSVKWIDEIIRRNCNDDWMKMIAERRQAIQKENEQ